jgi:hypothetical protein
MTDILDNWGQVHNNFEAASKVREHLLEHSGFVAIPLSVGHGTKFHISFVNLRMAIPPGYLAKISREEYEERHGVPEDDQKLFAVWKDFGYDDGSARGLQINIDRFKSYAINWGNAIGEPGYLGEKWGIEPSGRITTTPADLWPFFNTVLTGENYYEMDMPWLEQLGMKKEDVGRP